ncbi:MAG: hypothetical protein K8R31_08645 [Bacteroidales bacterium]|nr:hypothetical protein [Bacteroidales bacterium]
MLNTSLILHEKVSFQKNVWSDIEKELSLEEVLKSIKSETYAFQTNKLRNYVRTDNKEMYDTHKKRLAAVTFCGTFEVRKKVNLKVYNEILVLDIDKLDNDELKRVKSVLFRDNFIFSFWESPSGNGIKGLIKLEYLNLKEEYDQNNIHGFAFNVISKYFLESYDIELDESGKDITRLCFLSHDPNIAVKESYNPFKVNIESFEESEILKEKKEITSDLKSLRPINLKNKLYNPESRNDSNDRVTIQKIVRFLEKRKISITDSYDKWYKVAYAISNTFTYDLGEKYYLRLCRLDGSKHDELESKNMLRYCYEHSTGLINFNTLVFYAQKKGYEFKSR